MKKKLKILRVVPVDVEKFSHKWEIQNGYDTTAMMPSCPKCKNMDIIFDDLNSKEANYYDVSSLRKLTKKEVKDFIKCITKKPS